MLLKLPQLLLVCSSPLKARGVEGGNMSIEGIQGEHLLLTDEVN